MPAAQPFSATSGQVLQLVSLTPVAVPANATSIQTFTLGAAPGITLDPIQHQFVDITQFAWVNAVATQQPNGMFVGAPWIPAAGQLAVPFTNYGASSQTPVNGFYSLTVF